MLAHSQGAQPVLSVAAPAPGSPGGAPADAATVRHRILLIDDTAAIHSDFRKILSGDDTAALDCTEAELFGTPHVSAQRASFVLDSA